MVGGSGVGGGLLDPLLGRRWELPPLGARIGVVVVLIVLGIFLLGILSLPAAALAWAGWYLAKWLGR